jgi:hypothetical protein
VHPPDLKKNTTLEIKTSSFYWTKQTEGVSPTPCTCWMEGIFGLGWLNWVCYFRGLLLTTGWWDPAVCHEPCVNVNILGCDPYQHLSHDTWSLCFLTTHLVPVNIYLCSLVIFVGVLTTKITESCSFRNWFKYGLTMVLTRTRHPPPCRWLTFISLDRCHGQLDIQ